ncbi:hypothetical protein D1J60_12295 [Streptomyces sp. W1SF4]|nr:hypothetical protein D1J60_12295 [Streptomyces sp. W1SF4]
MPWPGGVGRCAGLVPLPALHPFSPQTPARLKDPGLRPGPLEAPPPDPRASIAGGAGFSSPAGD